LITSSVLSAKTIARLQEIAAMPAGWYEHKTPVTSPLALQRMVQFLEAIIDCGVPFPHLFPTLSGGLVAEWSLITELGKEGWEIDAEINDQQVILIHALNIQTQAEMTMDIVSGANQSEIKQHFRDFWETMRLMGGH
jgi:hypothetical protein